MADYFPRLMSRTANITRTRANLYVGYQVFPPAINSYQEETAAMSQAAHDELFSSLSSINSDDFLIGSFLSRTPDQEVFDRITRGIPDFSSQKYPEANNTLNNVHRHLRSGYLNERKRLHFLFVRYPTKTSIQDRFSAQLFNSDPFANTKDSDIATFEQKVFNAIPSSFRPVRTDPSHLDWIFERATTRGLYVPDAPRTGSPTVASGPRSFPEVDLSEAAKGTSILSDFVDRYISDDSDITGIDDSFRSNFRNLDKSDIIAVTRPDSRNEIFPSGMTSYQGVFAISGYPTADDYGFQNFTGIVDQASGLDGDFVMRFSYAPEMLDNDRMNKTLKNIADEDESNTESFLDADDYDAKRNEVAEWHSSVRSEAGPVPMRVTTVFAFGGANLEVTRQRMRSMRRMFNESGFKVIQPTGGQRELFKSMFPCYPFGAILEDLAGTTTAKLLGGYAPLRDYRIGDGVGIPFAVDISHGLGQIVHLDLLNATARGNASIACTGAQGKGKSHFMKSVVAWMNDLLQYSVMLDSQGEWATFASTLRDPEIVHVLNPKVSIDPLKVITEPKRASRVFVDVMLPMLGVRPDSEVAAEFARFCSPEARSVNPERNTARGVLESIAEKKDIVFKPILGVVKSMLNDPSMAALIDPVHMGRITVLPPVSMSSHNIVFLTEGLTLPQKGEHVADMTPSKRYTILVNTLVAMLTSYRFEDVRESCVFVGDEMKFYEGLGVLKPLIQDYDRTGRKVGNFVLAGSQTSGEMESDEYGLIRKRLAFGQEKRINSEGALLWADFEPTPALIHEHLHDTSPLDPENNNLPMEGREGECYFNDGTSLGRLRTLPQLSDARAQKADTRTEHFERFQGEQVVS